MFIKMYKLVKHCRNFSIIEKPTVATVFANLLVGVCLNHSAFLAHVFLLADYSLFYQVFFRSFNTCIQAIWSPPNHLFVILSR